MQRYCKILQERSEEFVRYERWWYILCTEERVYISHIWLKSFCTLKIHIRQRITLPHRTSEVFVMVPPSDCHIHRYCVSHNFSISWKNVFLFTLSSIYYLDHGGLLCASLRSNKDQRSVFRILRILRKGENFQQFQARVWQFLTLPKLCLHHSLSVALLCSIK